MLRRQTSGSVVCTSCGKLVGVQDERCWNCGRRNPSLWGFAPAIRNLGEDLGFRAVVITGCLLAYMLSLILAPGQITFSGLGFLGPWNGAVQVLGASGSLPVFQNGWWWTVLSAGWLHGGLVHIGFNLYWVNQLAPLVARMYGPGRAALIYLGASVTGFALTSTVSWLLPGVPPPFGGAQFTLGASAAIFGWLGALIHYGRRTGGTEFSRQIVSFAIPLFVFGLIMPGIDNWAHGGGFLGGYLLSRWFDPLEAERIDHLFLAMIGVVLCFVAMAVSAVKGWELLSMVP